jgi:hypothetical protein
MNQRPLIRALILGFAIVAPLVLIGLWPHAPLAGVGLVVLSHLLLLYPTLRPNVQWLGPVITHFATSRKEVWLTLDDGPTLTRARCWTCSTSTASKPRSS